MYLVSTIIINFKEDINRSFPELRLLGLKSPELELELELKSPELELELELKLIVSSGIGIGIGIENNGIGIGIELKKWNWPQPWWRRVRWSISTAHAQIWRDEIWWINYLNYVWGIPKCLQVRRSGGWFHLFLFWQNIDPRQRNRMAWQWAETLVEIRVTLADIRRTTKLGCNLNFPKHEFNRSVCLEAHHYLLAHLSQ